MLLKSQRKKFDKRDDARTLQHALVGRRKNDEEEENGRGRTKLAGCQVLVDHRMAEWGVTKKSSFTAKKFLAAVGKTGVGSNLAASGIFFEMLRSRETCCWMSVIRTRVEFKLVLSKEIICGASLQMKTRKKEPNRPLVGQSLICFV